MFYTARIGFRKLGIRAELDEQLGQNVVTFVNGFGFFCARLGKIDKPVVGDLDISPVLQQAYAARHAGFGIAQLVRDVDRPHRGTFAL